MTTLGEAAAVTPTYEQLRKFAVSIVREKLLHGSNPTLLTLAAKLGVDELTPLLEGAHEELTSPLTEARAEVRQLKAELETGRNDFASLLKEKLRVEADRDDLKRVRDEAVLWMAEEAWKQVHEWCWIDFANYAKQHGPERANGYRSRMEFAKAALERSAARDHESQLQRANFAKDQAQIASLRIDLEQAAKVTEQLVDGLSEETRKRNVAEVEVGRLKSDISEARPLLAEVRDGLHKAQGGVWELARIQKWIDNLDHCDSFLREPPPDEPVKCATFAPDTIPADVRAKMDADRKAAEAKHTTDDVGQCVAWCVACRREREATPS